MEGNSLTERNFIRPMFRRLFFPAILSSTGWALSDMADAVVVGQRLGTTGLAAISLILPVYMINCAMAHGFGLGGAVRFSHKMAQGDNAGARESFCQVFFTAMLAALMTAVLGIVFLNPLLMVLGASQADAAVVQATKAYLEILVASTPLFYFSNILNYYLRNDNNQRLAAAGSFIGNICDIVLNLFLVLVMNLGTRGAALSTSLGQIVTIAIYGIGLCRNENNMKLCFPVRGWLKEGFRQLKAGFASSVSYLYQMLFFLICNNALMRIGGEVAVAAFDVLQNTSYLVLYLYEGTSRAMQPLLTTFFGENSRSSLKFTRRIGFQYGIGIGTALLVFIELVPSAMCLLFGVEGEYARHVTEFALRVYCVGAFFAGINILESNYYSSCELERATLLIQTLRGAALLLPLTVLGMFGTLQQFWFIFPATEIGTALLISVLRRARRFELTLLPEERIYQRTVSGSNEAIMDADAEIGAYCEQRGIDHKRTYAITLAVEELCTSIVRNGMLDGLIRIIVLDEPDGSVELHLLYTDKAFNPFSLETEKASLDQEFDMDAIGIMMIRKQAQSFSYRKYQGCSSIVVRL